jgi:hypothetical protein
MAPPVDRVDGHAHHLSELVTGHVPFRRTNRQSPQIVGLVSHPPKAIGSRTMSIRYLGGDLRRMILECDAEDCPNTLSDKRALAMGMVPSPATGWKTVGVGTEERRDYCAEHAHLA